MCNGHAATREACLDQDCFGHPCKGSIQELLLLTSYPRNLKKYYLICSNFPLATGFLPCKDCRKEETESLAKHPLASDLIL